LAISLPPHGAPDRLSSFGERYIETYYESCVVGGPGAFVIAVSISPDFAKAIRRKFVLEISGLPARLQLAAHRPPSQSMDCTTIGQYPGR
jgi:hypothetical protein